MFGIQLDRPILYQHASLRYFKEGEYHVSRFCRDDVLVMVFDGVLRFTENGRQYAVSAGEYHIQRHDSIQSADFPSDAPKYLYVHFHAEWAEGEQVLPRSGQFDARSFMPLMAEIDQLSHCGALHIQQAEKFYALLSRLHEKKPFGALADNIAAYLDAAYQRFVTLDELSQEFHFSKNHIVNVFKAARGVTPIVYVNQLRLQKAKQLMEVTSDPLEDIAAQCGFQTYSHFYRLFHREHQLSPELWRKRRRLG